jgi:hypothetical protein
MTTENPIWEAPRIHRELRMLGSADMKAKSE